MTERDLRGLRKLLYFLPIITIVASLLIQWGSWEANSANYQKSMEEQRVEYEMRFQRIEKEKADADVVETKFNNIDWKLDMILKQLDKSYIVPFGKLSTENQQKNENGQK